MAPSLVSFFIALKLSGRDCKQGRQDNSLEDLKELRKAPRPSLWCHWQEYQSRAAGGGVKANEVGGAPATPAQRIRTGQQ